LKAESKRRIEANQITNDFITSYLEKLELGLQSRVESQFKAIETRIGQANDILTKIENNFQDQQTKVENLFKERSLEADSKIEDADLLLRNIKASQIMTNKKSQAV